MLFNSYEFIFLFLPISFLVYFFLNKHHLVKPSKVWLIAASLFFYSWWNIHYLPLIILSIVFNYTISQKMKIYANNNQQLYKKRMFQIGLIFNIGFLAYFKYMDFFIENINIVASTNFSLLHLALPLGISFFTLQQVAFLVDRYEGLIKKIDFLDYALFVTFFPQLIAGPIVHHKQMMPQFSDLRNKIKNYRHIVLGIFIFTIGLFKKVIIADTFALWAKIGFDAKHTLDLLDAWATSLSYTFQIYFDFSGYTDMAIGAALLFNIKLPQNFNSPYKATGIIDFWKRWHMTLTTFITTYIYTPILRLFKKPTLHKAVFSTMLAFLISGLWHGAGWTYIFWGFLHGIGLAINQYWRKSKRKIHPLFAWFITFNFINISLIFFRSHTFSDAIEILRSMFYLSQSQHLITTVSSQFQLQTWLWIIAAFIVTTYFKNSNEIISYKNFKNAQIISIKYGILFGLLCFISIIYLSLGHYTEFIYFNF